MSMALRIRLSRKGKKKHAFYHIVVAEANAPRNGRFVEKLGSYDPHKDFSSSMSINKERMKHWISVGAKPTEKVEKFLKITAI